MSTTIRLRLVIRRHAVPEVKLVWPCVANDDLTVARLLALVNEVVPLESGDWGLEDYVVELYDGKGDSFELLHFQPVGKVLKEDDQVLIRSLSTDDLRRRKLSGRHQISYDGKHLIDGLAFGRPWLRAPRDRPALDLPPRKRARITHEEELDEDDDDGSYADEENQSEQLLLEDSEAPEMGEPGSVRMRVRFMDSDQLEDEDEDEDLEDLEDENEFQPIEEAHAETAADEEDEDDAESIDEDDLDADLSDELRLLQEDNAIVEQTPAKEQETLLSGDDSQDPQSLLPTHGFDVSWLDKITALRAAFPLTPVSTLQDEMNRNKDLRKTYEKLAEANKPVINYDEALERVLLGPGFPDALSPDQPADEEEEDPEDRVLLLPGQAEHKDATRPLIQEIEEESAPVSTPRVSQDQISRPLISEVPDEEKDTSSSSSSLDSDSDPDSDAEYDVDMEKKLDSESNSDSDDSDDDSSDDSDFPAPATPSRPAKTTQEDSEDSDSSDSDSDSDSDSSSDSSNGAEATKDSAESDSDNSSDSSSDSDSSSSESDSESEPEEISSKRQPQTKQPQPQPPAKTEPEPRASGQTAKAASEPTQGPKPPGTGLARTQKRNARKRDAKRLKAIQALEDTPSQPSVNGTASEEAELLARKRALLSVVSDEQEDESRPPKDAPNKETRPMIVEIEVEEETPAVTTSQDLAPVEEEPMPAQRRHKVDMGAGRRLLLGALGIKNPKNKAEEDKLRDSLMKNVKPLQNPRVQVEEDKVKDDKPAEEQPDEDPEAWRKKISYRAVECCHNDVVLSEPPFPFVQRWDPQQQYGSMRKRKRASQNFNDESYYEEDSQQWNGDEEWNDNSQRKKKKNKKRKNKSGYDGEYDEEESREGSFGTGANGDEDIVLNYDDIPTKHRPEESQFTDTDDLPSLPSDVTTLPSLSLSDMKPGMVATWKQLVMSKATNWQPEMVQMTGLILSISEDNCMHVLLAMRDREGNDKEYDEHTGQRIYAKFEAPDLDEDEEDDGRREIPWTEMSDPRLVQPAPPPTMLETSAKSIKLQAEQNKPVQNGNSTANNKVSARTDPDETMAEELDTQKVRAEVEADLRGQETEGQPSGTDKSTSIPSGQQPPRLEFPPSGNDSPMSSFVQPAGPWGKFDSHIHQLRESMQASMSQLQSLLSRDSDKGKQDNEEEDKAGNDEPDGAKDAKESEGEPVPTAEGSWDAVIPDTIPSPELPPLPTKDGVVVDHRLLVVPSSAGSVRSGRQPPSASGLDDLPEERIEESVEGGIVDDPHGRSASPQVTNNSRPRSSSPFPSLEEIFHTARQTQSPFKFSQMSVPQFIKSEKKDGDYEEAMRKLDEGEESDRSPDRNKSLRSLLLNATQPESQKGSPLVRSFKSEGSKPEASEPQHATTPPTSQKVKQESQFAIPEGSQVIELSSSPVSVQYAEDYAQDSEDETYQDSPLPQGSGWVQKKQSEVNTRSRGRSLPATEAKKTTVVQSRTTRGQTSAPVARGVSTSAYSQIKGRRKTTRKF